MPLFTLDDKLLVRSGLLAAAEACCCNCNDYGWSDCLNDPPPNFPDMQLTMDGYSNDSNYTFGTCTSTCHTTNLNSSFTLPFIGESPYNRGASYWKLEFLCQGEDSCDGCILVVERDNCGVSGATEVYEYVYKIEAEVECNPTDGKVYLSYVGFGICSCQTTSEGLSCSDVWFPHNLTCMGGVSGCCGTQIQGARYRDPCEILGTMIAESDDYGCASCNEFAPVIGTVTFEATVGGP